MTDSQRRRRGHDFRPADPSGIPKLYATERVPTAEKVLHLHYFLGGNDWWVAEYDPAEDLAFGYACLGDPANAEWGYVSLEELEAISVGPLGMVVERDLDWTPTRAAEAGLPGWRA